MEFGDANLRSHRRPIEIDSAAPASANRTPDAEANRSAGRMIRPEETVEKKEPIKPQKMDGTRKRGGARADVIIVECYSYERCRPIRWPA